MNGHALWQRIGTHQLLTELGGAVNGTCREVSFATWQRICCRPLLFVLIADHCTALHCTGAHMYLWFHRWPGACLAAVSVARLNGLIPVAV